MVSPVMVADVAGGLPAIVVAVCATAATYGVIVYAVIGLPPFDGAVHDTFAVAFPATADTPVGAAGTVGPVGVTVADGADAGPDPMAFVAVTVKVYAVPFARPVIAADVTGGLPVIVVAD